MNIKEIIEYDKKPDIFAVICDAEWKMQITTVNRFIPDYEELEKKRGLLDRFLNTELFIKWDGRSDANLISFLGSQLSTLFPYFKIRFIKSKIFVKENSTRSTFIIRISIPRWHYPKVYRKIAQLKLSE